MHHPEQHSLLFPWASVIQTAPGLRQNRWHFPSASQAYPSPKTAQPPHSPTQPSTQHDALPWHCGGQPQRPLRSSQTFPFEHVPHTPPQPSGPQFFPAQSRAQQVPSS